MSRGTVFFVNRNDEQAMDLAKRLGTANIKPGQIVMVSLEDLRLLRDHEKIFMVDMEFPDEPRSSILHS